MASDCDKKETPAPACRTLRPVPDINTLILTIRDQKVLLDADLATIYGVETRALNQALKRNQDRFPDDFVFALTRAEILGISQTVTSLRKLKFSKQVHAFTEHGALMAANVLNSPRAAEMSVYVIRAFVKMRAEFVKNQGLALRLAEIEKTLLSHDTALRDLYQKIRPLLLPPPEPKRREIGFHAKPTDEAQPKGKKETPAPVCRKRPRKDFRGQPAESVTTTPGLQT